MDPRERLNDMSTALLAGQKAGQSKLWTGFPGIVESFDAEKMTCSVQPAIKSIQITSTKDKDELKHVALPLLLDCPVMYPSGGDVTLTMPIKKGDECWVNIANRCIDGWWQSGGVQQQMEQRMHDLSDGFVFVGVWSKPNALSNVSTTTGQLRSKDGSTFIELDPDGQTIIITAPGGATINADTTINGTLHVTGQITCDDDVVASDISLVHHTHPDVQSGSSDTGEPNS